ncbi:MAG: CocE/NonD family hydrolase [bacterium]|jgi:putative CocE/NonD family hydrolase|nr:CocE/NonD family hydrolase [Gemmatimonadota bacterium]
MTEVSGVGPICREVGLQVPMSDGLSLVADCWRPTGDEQVPVLLMRLPYGRSVASTPVLPHPAWFARRGYAVVIQDSRGRGDSEGQFRPFLDEARDGAETIEWAAALPFSDGQVATYGFSYQGINQLYAAAERPEGLRAIAPMMCCPDPYEGWTYYAGVPRWSFISLWAAQLAGQELREGTIPYDLDALPMSTALGDAPPDWFEEWIRSPDGTDPYWEVRRPNLSAIEVPVFSVLGWFDEFSSGTAALIEALDAEAICGPWAHMPWSTQASGFELGPGATPAIVGPRLLAFFDRVLKGIGEPPDEKIQWWSPRLGWSRAPQWPPPTARPQEWTANSAGNANSRNGDGSLTTQEINSPLMDLLVVEPHNPYPGELPFLQDEAASEDRRDVICYTSKELGTALTVAGSPTVEVTVRADQPSIDIVATLLIVTGSGESRALTTGVCRARIAGDTAVKVVLRPVGWTIDADQCLRLDLSGSRFPLFSRNPHTPYSLPSTSAADHVVATVEFLAARLSLPVVPQSIPI